MLDQPRKENRRKFFQTAAAGTALLTLAPGVRLVDLAVAKDDADEVTDNTRWGMLVDTSRCATDCDACVSACAKEHSIEDTGRPDTDAQWIRKVDLKDKKTGRELSLPLMCQHCDEPPCVDVCPTGASFKRADGIVLVDKHTCIGCRYCMMACPFDARSFIHEKLSNQRSYAPRGKGTVESCTFCVHRVDKDQAPACVEACAEEGHHALVFGDLNDKDSEISRSLAEKSTRELRPSLNLGTGALYHGL
ncbi:MAG: 4Fe-4S ferredoxin [Acidiferrobacteraceae bacterium]|nr:4Fe-4S ferredoxin [Acidiferrobacteraceae bacterium]